MTAPRSKIFPSQFSTLHVKNIHALFQSRFHKNIRDFTNSHLYSFTQ